MPFCTRYYLSCCAIFQGVAPVILTSTGNVTILLHQTPLELQCEVDGNPFPKIDWQHRQNDHERWHTLRHRSSARARYAKAGQTLEFEKLQLSDIGFYQCIARNDHGTAYSDPLYLDIQGTCGMIYTYHFYILLFHKRHNCSTWQQLVVIVSTMSKFSLCSFYIIYCAFLIINISLFQSFASIATESSLIVLTLTSGQTTAGRAKLCIERLATDQSR